MVDKLATNINMYKMKSGNIKQKKSEVLLHLKIALNPNHTVTSEIVEKMLRFIVLFYDFNFYKHVIILLIR